MAQCSRILYVFCHSADLWRDLTLLTFKKGVTFHQSWKDTFARMRGATIDHVPITMSGVYCNTLYRPWLCRYSDLDESCPGFSTHNDIDRRSAHSLSPSLFVSEYESKNIPVIITDLVSDWGALRRWSPEYLSKCCGNRLFRATSATAADAAYFTMEEYWKYASAASEEAPLYLFERDFAKVQGLQDDYKVPPHFSAEADHGSDLFSLLGAERRPDHKWLVIGPKRSGSIFHIDPNQTNAWNVVVRGRKKWIFYPPHVDPPGVLSSIDGADVTVPLSTGEWLLSFWKFHLQARADPDVSRRPLECVQEEGQAIFVPHGYWHMVVNLEDSIALTHNYVSSSNLGDVLHFLDHKQDQVSGVRDRHDVALQPEELYETFREALGKAKPDLLKHGLEEALRSEEREGKRLRQMLEAAAHASPREAGRKVVNSGCGRGKRKCGAGDANASAGAERDDVAREETKRAVRVGDVEGRASGAASSFSFSFF